MKRGRPEDRAVVLFQPGPSHQPPLKRGRLADPAPAYPIYVGPTIQSFKKPNPRYQKMQRSTRSSSIAKNSKKLEAKGPEKKVLDEILDLANPMDGANTRYTATQNFWQFHQGPSIDQGSNINNRVGSRVSLKSINARLQFKPVATAATPNLETIVRVMCLIDYQSNGAGVSASNVINSNNNAGFSCYGYRNLNNNTRFRTLVDDMFTLHEQYDGDLMYAVREYNFKTELDLSFSGANPVSENSFREASIRWIVIHLPVAQYAMGEAAELEIDGHVRYRYTDQ